MITVPAVRAATAALLLAGLGACHHFDPRSYTDPSDLLRASLRELRAGQYGHAQTGFQVLTFNVSSRDTLYPLARFYLAEAYFGQEDYPTAAREFRRVADESPAFRLAPEALVRAGDAYAAQWTSTALDPSNGQSALATYQEAQSRFPDAPAARVAGVRIRALNERFADKEMANALFYFQRGAYDSAILYFKDLIASYSSSTLVPEAYVYLVRSYQAIGWKDELGAYCDQLRAYYAPFYRQRADVREMCGDRSAGR
ncbi:MAG TPA: outer membrane protein assembly factor BamD [Gemmatimonadales bacterium]|nr:outer membrane protein assembly factor BamD [Gemmatimonadales bacterium]